LADKVEGAVIPQYQKILDYIDVAKGEGAEVVLGGGKANHPECGDGWFVEPTIFTGRSNPCGLQRRVKCPTPS
jgi:aldehyde dehydrogenase (NAD+)